MSTLGIGCNEVITVVRMGVGAAAYLAWAGSNKHKAIINGALSTPLQLLARSMVETRIRLLTLTDERRVRLLKLTYDFKWIDIS